MIIIRRLLVLLLITVCCGLVANADNDKSFKCEGNTYSSTGRVNNSSAPISTGCTWIDSKSVQCPVYMSNSGSCYIIKTSKNNGKEYKQYLKPEVSQDICKKLGKEYKSNKK